MMIIDGKKEAENLRLEIKKEIDLLKSKNNKVPGLRIRKKVLKRWELILMLSDTQKM